METILQWVSSIHLSGRKTIKIVPSKDELWRTFKPTAANVVRVKVRGKAKYPRLLALQKLARTAISTNQRMTLASPAPSPWRKPRFLKPRWEWQKSIPGTLLENSRSRRRCFKITCYNGSLSKTNYVSIGLMLGYQKTLQHFSSWVRGVAGLRTGNTHDIDNHESWFIGYSQFLWDRKFVLTAQCTIQRIKIRSYN